MKTLIVAEHDNQTLKAATLNAVAAAQQLGGDVDILVVGSGCEGAANAAAAVAGVGTVLCADNAAYEHQLAENVSLAVADAASSYDCVMSAATANGKNVMPRVAALLDVAQISDITAVIDADTFERPIYAGNVIATVKSSDSKKVITVRTTAFDAVPAEGGRRRCKQLTVRTMRASQASLAKRWQFQIVQNSLRLQSLSLAVVVCRTAITSQCLRALPTN